MVYLIVIGICLYLYGAIRTLTIYFAIVVTAITLILAEAVGLGFSYLFWPESVRAFNGGDYWVSQFVNRESFHIAEAPAVPIIFFFDLVRKGFQFCWQVPNVFSIGVFAYWWFMMYQLWITVVVPMIIPKTNAASKT